LAHARRRSRLVRRESARRDVCALNDSSEPAEGRRLPWNRRLSDRSRVVLGANGSGQTRAFFHRPARTDLRRGQRANLRAIE
jgi:hypothetical protein